MRNSKCWGRGGAPQPIFSIRENAALHFESNGVMNGGFTEVHALRASAPFSAQHGRFVSRWVLWKFRPPYTRTDSQIAAPACIFAYMEGKKRKKMEKSLGWRQAEGEKCVGRKCRYAGRKSPRTAQNSWWGEFGDFASCKNGQVSSAGWVYI